MKTKKEQKELMVKFEEEFPELYGWFGLMGLLEELECKADKFILINEYCPSTAKINFSIYTDRYEYKFVAIKPGKERENGYLACGLSGRKPRAGEDFTGGRDLADGSYSFETFQKIMFDIVNFELVKMDVGWEEDQRTGPTVEETVVTCV